MESCRRIVAGRWQCPGLEAGRRRNALYSARACFPSFFKEGWREAPGWSWRLSPPRRLRRHPSSREEGITQVDHAPPHRHRRRRRRNPRQLRRRAQEARLRGERARGARRGDGRVQDAAPRSRRDRHRPGRGARRGLHAVPRAPRAGSQPAHPFSHRARFRLRRGLGPATGRRRLSHQGRGPGAPARAHLGAVSQDRCAARAEGGRGSARARGSQARRKALHRVVERQARRADAHRVLDGAHAREIPRPREGPRGPHARGEPRRRRGHDHLAREAHPQEIRRGRSRVRADRYGVRDGLPLEGMKLPALSLRTKLALVALLLLALPWAGYEYVREMERFLLEGEEQALLATARAVATALHDRPGLMRARASRDDDPLREAEEELRRLAAERGEAQPEQGAEPTLIIDREEAAAKNETEEIGEILRAVERSTARIWVVTRELRVLALAGSLRREEAEAEETLTQRVLGLLIPRPSEDFDDAIDDGAPAPGRDISGALQGRPGFRLRNTPDGKAVVISAAHPIWNGDEVAGAVVVEESTNPILSVRSRALERLLVLTLAAFAVAAAVLIWFATRISTRIRRLRDEAETAIDARGRLAHLVTAQNAGDEIGDLSRSFSAMLAKLSQHHAYLESLASRLSHELRTPIAVVRSSLENLKLAPADARVSIERAEEGLRRLGTIRTRMSEATRLEQGLASFERERFDLAAVVAACVEGYRLAYPEKPFELRRPQEKAVTLGSPDLAAQLLDKFVANAVDFAAAGKRAEPIRISLSVANGFIELGVENKGPLLPEEMRGKLFESMVSVRGERRGEGKSAEPHLGLGLY